MDLPGFDIRYSEEGDLSFMERWFAEPRVCDGFPFTYEEREFPLKNWIGFSKYKASLTGLVEGQPVAVGTLFLMPYRKVAHHSSFYLIVDAKWRRKGIGTSMVKNLLHLAQVRFRLESVHVEIFLPNPLVSVVKKVGFVPFAEQEGAIKIEGKLAPRLLLEKFFV